MRGVLLLYGIWNAVLYAGLLPLWDGFDEPFHYAYVQHLARYRTLPAPGATAISLEVARSLELAPASYVVKRNIPRAMAFDEYFALPEQRRVAMRRELESLDPRLALTERGGFNYEAHHAPLAYVLLAPWDALWARQPLIRRVLHLRILCALCATLMTGVLTLRLAGRLGLAEPVALAALFLVFSSQMFYATCAHVGNDWLAVPLFLLLLERAVVLWGRPSRRHATVLAIVLVAGLLTKAYFLAMVPFALGLVLLRCRREALIFLALLLGAGAPWYVRNTVVYRNPAGMQETAQGTPAGELARTALRFPWLAALDTTARSSLWTGNSSSSAFGRRTITAMLALLLLAAVLYAAHAIRKGVPAEERIVWTGMLCFGAALAYVAVLTFWATRGAGISPAPWYVQVLFPPGLVVLAAGLGRGGRPGGIVLAGMLGVWAYVMAATYAAKLIPLYAGYPEGSVRLAALLRWYGTSFRDACRVLDTMAMMPAWAVLGLAAVAVVGAPLLACVLISQPARLRNG